jgi:hypothetical protein|tara:strand:+ start:364 stop:636 length:273 start_codon:yes stop_codon:yes gene_type:complete
MQYQHLLTDREKQVSHLLPLYEKEQEAERKMTEAMNYSDWSRSIAAYKAAHTKASKQLDAEIIKHLGDAAYSIMEKRIAIIFRLQHIHHG